MSIEAQLAQDIAKLEGLDVERLFNGGARTLLKKDGIYIFCAYDGGNIYVAPDPVVWKYFFKVREGVCFRNGRVCTDHPYTLPFAINIYHVS